ncbi:MAG: hypothetical protein ACR2QO_24625 [Acidimicrobiales bacterium]
MPDADERLQWQNDIERRDRQPDRGKAQRLADRVLAMLPIRDYL